VARQGATGQKRLRTTVLRDLKADRKILSYTDVLCTINVL